MSKAKMFNQSELLATAVATTQQSAKHAPLMAMGLHAASASASAGANDGVPFAGPARGAKMDASLFNAAAALAKVSPMSLGTPRRQDHMQQLAHTAEERGFQPDAPQAGSTCALS